jgi:hypothetical protein
MMRAEVKMRLVAMMLLIGAAGCGGSPKKPATKPSHPVGGATAPIDGPGVGADLSKCGTLAKAELCKCLADDADVCDFVDDGKLPAHVLRAGNGQQTDTFLVVEDQGGLRAIAELLYEQHHGKRNSDLSEPKLELSTIHGARVLRLEFTASAETDYANDGYDENLKGTAVKVCVLDGAPGTPGCPVSSYLSCTTERTDYSDPPHPANTGKGASTGRVEIAEDGTVTVTKLTETGAAYDCAVESATVHLLP